MLRLVMIAVLAAGGVVLLQQVELDERMMWAGLLPLTYIAGLILLAE